MFNFVVRSEEFILDVNRFFSVFVRAVVVVGRLYRLDPRAGDKLIKDFWDDYILSLEVCGALKFPPIFKLS